MQFFESEKKGDPHHKILIFNSAQLTKRKSLQCFQFERQKEWGTGSICGKI